MPADIEEKNAIITAATITSGDYGLLSAWLTLDYGNSGCQGFGGYSLYLPKSFNHHTINGPAGHFIWRVMEIAGVEKWDALVGKTIRVRASHSGVQAIGHIVKDDWFVPSVDLAGVGEDTARLDWLEANAKPHHGVIVCGGDVPGEEFMSLQRVDQWRNPHKVEWCHEAPTLRATIDAARAAGEGT